MEQLISKLLGVWEVEEGRGVTFMASIGYMTACSDIPACKGDQRKEA
jgi:hypothetical protein